MDILWIRIVSQAGVYVTFALYLAWAARRGVREWAPLVSACGYAVLFEHWNMLRYAHSQGGYHYHTGSWGWVWGDVPLYIPLAWAFILATSRALTDRLPMRPWARPFADALFALLIDASMDAVAIRLHFWYWHGVGITEGFFGVPADNFVGWLLVSFTFSALTRRLWSEGGGTDRRAVETAAANARSVPSDTGNSFLRPVAVKTLAQIVLLPPMAYAAYLGLEAAVHLQYAVFHAESLRGQLFVLAGTLMLFACVVIVGLRLESGQGRSAEGAESRPVEEAFVHGPRHIFHVFGLVGLLFVPVALRTPALWGLAAGVWALEWAIALAAARRPRHPERM